MHGVDYASICIAFATRTFIRRPAVMKPVLGITGMKGMLEPGLTKHHHFDLYSHRILCFCQWPQFYIQAQHTMNVERERCKSACLTSAYSNRCGAVLPQRFEVDRRATRSASGVM